MSAVQCWWAVTRSRRWPARSTWRRSSPPGRWRGRWPPRPARCCRRRSRREKGWWDLHQWAVLNCTPLHCAGLYCTTLQYNSPHCHPNVHYHAALCTCGALGVVLVPVDTPILVLGLLSGQGALLDSTQLSVSGGPSSKNRTVQYTSVWLQSIR